MADVRYPVTARAVVEKYKDMGDGTHALVVALTGVSELTVASEVEVKNDTGNPIPVSPNITRGSGAIDSNTQRVTLATDGPGVAALSSIDAKIGNAANPSATFNRPADTTAYAIGDLVANSTTAGSVVAMSLTVARAAAGSFMIRRVKLRKSNTSITSASFRVHFFRTAPSTVTNGDNGAFSVSGVADYIGAVDVTMDRAFTDGAVGFGVPIVGSDFTIKLASGTTIVALLEARAAYTPASGETFAVELDDLQN